MLAAHGLLLTPIQVHTNIVVSYQQTISVLTLMHVVFFNHLNLAELWHELSTLVTMFS